MPKIRFLSIQFENQLLPREIPCFRAAVIEQTQRASSLFHNHRDPEGFHYRYPFIQYKIMRGKAAVVCLNDGTDDIHHLLQRRDLTLRIGDRTDTFRIEDVRLNYFNVQTWQNRFRYSLLNWIALNQKNYQVFRELESEAERILFLERILTGNILALAKYIGWTVEERIEVTITGLQQSRFLPYKGQDVLTFSLDFTCNVSLPDWVGVGKGASVGFGVVRQIRRRPEKNEGRARRSPGSIHHPETGKHKIISGDAQGTLGVNTASNEDKGNLSE